MARTVLPNGDVIRKCREDRGWQIDDLANKTGCSLRTVQNLEKGRPCYKCTLVTFADVFKVDYNCLLLKLEPVDELAEEAKKPDMLITFSITLNKSRGELDESDQLLEFMNRLESLISGWRGIEVNAINQGSVILTVVMTSSDILAAILNRAFAIRFNEVFIHAIQLPPHVRVFFPETGRRKARWLNKIEFDDLSSPYVT